MHWKDWCGNRSSNALAIWCKELTHWKRPDDGKGWRQEEKGTTEDEMVGWHHQLNGHESEQALGVGDRQGSLAYCSPWGHEELDMTERLNDWSELTGDISLKTSLLWSGSERPRALIGHLDFLLPPSIFPSIRGFLNESVLCIRWPKYWSFSLSISPSNKYSGLIFFRTDWFDLLAVQGTLKSLL